MIRLVKCRVVSISLELACGSLDPRDLPMAGKEGTSLFAAAGAGPLVAGTGMAARHF